MIDQLTNKSFLVLDSSFVVCKSGGIRFQCKTPQLKTLIKANITKRQPSFRQQILGAFGHNS